MSLCYSCFKEYDSRFGICPFCGSETITEPKEKIHLPPGTLLAERYIIGTAIGEGGFGVVYKAYDQKFGCIVAIKEFFSSRLFTRYPGERDVKVSRKNAEEFKYRKNRFLTEARFIARYNSNNNIVGVLDHFEENGTAYIVMQLLQGVSLSQYLVQKGGKIGRDEAVSIIEQVCAALHDLHKDNIIHCDIAPDNIVLLDGLKVKVFDFGAAKLADSEDVAIDICMKPGYSPPEQYDQSNNLGAWTDIYAVGATLYHMLSGIKPDESTNRKVADTVVPLHQLDPEIPENLSNTVMKAMAVEKHMRFRSVDELTAALAGEKKVVSLEKEKKRRRLKRLGGIAAACLLAAGAGLLVWNAYSDKRTEQYLEPAELSVWYSVSEGSGEQAAMESIKEDFESKFPDVKLELKAIPEAAYEAEIRGAVESGSLPQLFESSGLSDELLDTARDVQSVTGSEQARDCLFLDMYNDYYSTSKRVPLAIEAPVACVITAGKTSVSYEGNVFSELSDLGTDSIAIDDDCRGLIEKNFSSDWLPESSFMDNESNTCAVMLSSTIHINVVRTKLTKYEKKFVFAGADKVKCDFIYEWSLGRGSKSQEKAADRLLCWMLGNVYQNKLMVSIASDGQIPLNRDCFDDKCSGRNYAGIKDVCKNYVF